MPQACRRCRALSRARPRHDLDEVVRALSVRRLAISPRTGVLLGVLVALVAGYLTSSAYVPSGTGLTGIGIVTLPFAAVGLVVASRRPRNSIGWILLGLANAFLLVAVSMALGAIFGMVSGKMGAALTAKAPVHARV